MIFKERRRRFAMLVAGRFKGQEAAASALGFGGAGAVSNYKLRKNMGEDVARRVEKLAKLPKGSMLDPLNTAWLLDDREETGSPLIDINKNLMDGDRLDVNLSTSSQLDERNPKHAHVQSYELWRGDVATEIRRMSVPLEWLEQEGLDVDQLVTIEMPDDSQEGLVSRGYIIAVNIDWGGKLKDGLHYAIDIGGTPTVRRADFEYNDDLVLTCLNSKHRDQPVSKAEISTLNIIGICVRFQGSFPKTK